MYALKSPRPQAMSDAILTACGPLVVTFLGEEFDC